MAARLRHGPVFYEKPEKTRKDPVCESSSYGPACNLFLVFRGFFLVLIAAHRRALPEFGTVALKPRFESVPTSDAVGEAVARSTRAARLAPCRLDAPSRWLSPGAGPGGMIVCHAAQPILPDTESHGKRKMTEKQQLIRRMLEMQRKFIAYEHQRGITPRQYHDDFRGQELENHRREFDELADRVVNLAHAEIGSVRD